MISKISKFFSFVYNPWKPHVVQSNDGRYAIRKLTDSGWQFLDAEDMGYWWSIYAEVYAFTDLETIKKNLRNIKKQYKRVDIG